MYSTAHGASPSSFRGTLIAVTGEKQQFRVANTQLMLTMALAFHIYESRCSAAIHLWNGPDLKRDSFTRPCFTTESRREGRKEARKILIARAPMTSLSLPSHEAAN